MIVDCGGGTVDLISYKVTKTSPMEVREVVKGEGQFRSDCTGPTLVDRPTPFPPCYFGQSGCGLADEKFTGALCGAIFVDERFEDLLKHKLTLIKEDALSHMEENEFREMMTVNWENGIRKAFTGAPREWSIRYPYSLLDQDTMRDGRGFLTFTITSEEIEEVFRPIMENIRDLVVHQINAVVTKEDKLPKVSLFHC